ncbi:unnamed protein product, partial [Adineta ricciae]
MSKTTISSDEDNSEVVADSDSDLESEVFTDSDYSTSDPDDSTSDPDDSITHSNDSIPDLGEKEEPPSKKKKTEFFNWKHGIFVPKTFYFDNSNGGIRSISRLGNDPIDYFELFFDKEIMEYIAEETNRYQKQNSSPSSEKSHKGKWYATNFQEIYVFIATTMLMGVVQKNRLKDYGSTDPIITTPIFRELFPRDRYLSILRMLHFVNNDEKKTGKLYKMLPIIRHMQVKFQQFFKPFQKLCIDESILPWKGNLSFRQYIPSKRHRFGIKLFILCDCETNYILDFIIYTGADTEIERIDDLGVSGSIVMTLLKPYLQKGHVLYTDNWYTSPKLFLELYYQGTGAVGTVKKKRKTLKWMDKREVYMLSTVHDSQMITIDRLDHKTGSKIMKPICVQDYNENMGAIDLVDMQSSFTECIRKMLKWYKKFFFHIVDMASINAFYLYKTQNLKNLQLKEFRLQLIKNIGSKYGDQKQLSLGRLPTDPQLRLSARHFPSLVVSTASKVAAQRRCY